MQPLEPKTEATSGSSCIISGTTTSNVIELLRASAVTARRRTFRVTTRDLPLEIGREQLDWPCVAVLAEPADIANLSCDLEIKCYGPANEPNRHVLILLGNSSVAIDVDSLDVNLLLTQCFLVLFVHAVGWTIARFNITSGDKQRLLAALLGNFKDVDCRMFSQVESNLLADIRFGSLDSE